MAAFELPTKHFHYMFKNTSDMTTAQKFTNHKIMRVSSIISVKIMICSFVLNLVCRKSIKMKIAVDVVSERQET